MDLFTSDVFIEIEGEEWFDSAKGWTKEVSDAPPDDASPFSEGFLQV